MILKYSELSKNSRMFQRFTGVSVEEFEDLETKAEPIWVEAEEKRLSRSDRQRAVGGGRVAELTFRNQLLMTLVWLRLYLIQDGLGYLFGVDKSSVSRYVNRILPVLRVVGEDTLGWAEPPKRGHGRSLEQVWSEEPDLYAYVDATEQRINRSSDAKQQKEDYSGKKKYHTRKVQVVVNEDGVVRDVSESTPGSMHDRKHFTHSGVAGKIPDDIVMAGDAGYQGIQDYLPNHSVITPFKNTRNNPLNDEQKALNREFSSGRIIVENTICQFTHFGALAQRFRHNTNNYDNVFRAVLAIVNPRIQKRVSEAYAT